jgi:soluble lytic murein transglycosylase-like protein
MLASLLNQGGGETEAASLVERANLEALLSSGRFGNLLGGPKFSGSETGLTLNARDLNSWRQKNGPLSLGRPASASEAALLAAGPGQAYLIRPPQRSGQARFEVGESPPDQPRPGLTPAVADLKADGQTAPVQTAAVQPAAVPPAAVPSLAEPLAGPAVEAGADKFTPDQLDKLVHKIALALNMDPHLIKAVIKTESNFNPKAVSKAGAQGLMQLMPTTAKELGVKDPFNPVENVWAGARYLKKMLDRHSGNINNALASYNWGPGNFDRHGGLRLPGETRRYISAVNKHYAKLKQNNASSA